MRITKSERIWLALSVLFYALYNIPGVPAYENPRGMLIHGVLTVLPLWIVTYVGMKKVYSVYKLKDQKKAKEADTNA